MKTKQCNGCDQTKLPSQFHRDRTRHDGLSRKCKVCNRASRNHRNIVRHKKRQAMTLAEVLPTVELRVRTIRRIMARITEVHGTLSTVCWVWTGPLRSGYGSTAVRGKRVAVHRLLWFLLRGSIPRKPLQLNHRCNYGRGSHGCVRPDHMYVGTGRDNAADKKRLAA